jgi:hypothetical protein
METIFSGACVILLYHIIVCIYNGDDHCKSSSNKSTVLFQAASTTVAIDSTPCTCPSTQATSPILHGSFLPLTAFPAANLSGLTEGGMYRGCNDIGRSLRYVWLACVDVIEHQGASDHGMKAELQYYTPSAYQFQVTCGTKGWI